MKQDTHNREKEQAELEHSEHQLQTRNDIQDAKDQDFYARLGLVEPDANPPEDMFVISIHSEHWTLEDLEAGEAHIQDIKVDRMTVDTDELIRLGREYGFSEPSFSNCHETPTVWFHSTFPPEDRAYFEQGVQKYYSLHTHEVNGHPPSPEDYQRVADLIGVSFDHTVQLPHREQQEGPDLCL